MDQAPGRNITVTIEEGASNRDIAELMEENGLVEDWKLFYIQIQVSKYAKRLEPGTYTLSTAMKPREMMAVISREGEEKEEEEE